MGLLERGKAADPAEEQSIFPVVAALDLPADAAAALCASVRRLQAALHENLVSCILYGGAVRGNYAPESSDLNLLLVLRASTPEAHAAIAGALEAPARIAPWILPSASLGREAQAFALKFQSIGRNYRVLHGEDVLAGLKFDAAMLAFLAEQELRNFRSRLAFNRVVHGRNRERYGQYLMRIGPRAFAVLSDALRCAGEEVPSDFKDRIPLIEAKFKAEAKVLLELLDLKRKPRAIGAEEAAGFHSRLFRLADRAVAWTEERWPESRKA